MTPCSACSFPHAAPNCPRCGAPATMAGYGGAATAQQYNAPPMGGGYGQGFGVAPVPYTGVGGNPYPVGGMPMGELDTKNTMILAIVAFLFCQPAGIIAVVLAEEAKKIHRQGRPEDAQRKLGHARTVVFVGLGLGALFVVAYILLLVITLALA